VLGVQDLKKDDYQRCEHRNCDGCSIYGDRPPECKAYKCLWLNSFRNELEFRPDILGVILEITETELGGRTRFAVLIREVRPGASEDAAVRALADSIAQPIEAFFYIIREDGGRSAVFPPWAEHLRKYCNFIVCKSWKDVEREENGVKKKCRRNKKDKRKRKLAVSRRNR
jgi:hypothetical protein